MAVDFSDPFFDELRKRVDSQKTEARTRQIVTNTTRNFVDTIKPKATLPVFNKRKRDAVMAMADPKNYNPIEAANAVYDYQKSDTGDLKSVKKEVEKADRKYKRKKVDTALDLSEKATEARMRGDWEEYNRLVQQGTKTMDESDLYKQQMDARKTEDAYIENQKKIDKMQAVRNNPDFAISSAAGAGIQVPKGHTTAEIKNPVKYAKESGLAPVVDNATGGTPITYTGAPTKYKYLTDDEYAVYNYYLGRGEKKQAQEYLDLLDGQLNERGAAADAQTLKQQAKEKPALGVATNVASTLLTPLAYGATVGQNIKNAVTGEYEPIDPNSPYMRGVQAEQATREGLTEGKGEFAKGLINTGLSMGQFLSKVPMGPAALPYMAAGAAGQTSQEAAARGATAEQALQLGTISGLTEYATEKLPLENLLSLGKEGVKAGVKSTAKDRAKAAFKAVLKQAGTEGTEEAISEYSGLLADRLIMGSRSEYDQYIKQLEEQGLTLQQAQSQALIEFAIKNPAASFAGGALSGGIMGAGGVAVGEVNTRRAGRNINQSGQLDTLIDQGLQAPKGSDLYNAADALRQQAETGKLSNRDIGQFARMMQEGTPEIEPQQGENTAPQELYQATQDGTIQAENDGLQTTIGGVEDGGTGEGRNAGGFQEIAESLHGDRPRQGSAHTRTAEEQGAFLGRIQEARLQSKAIGDAVYAYKEVPEADYTPVASAARAELEKLGVKSFIIDGDLSVNAKGFTETSFGEASTIADGSVAIRNNISLDPKSVAGHEFYHVVQREKSELAENFYTAITDGNINFGNKDLSAYMEAVANTYFGDGFDVTEGYNNLFKEFVAFMSGKIYAYNGRLPESTQGWFYNPQQVETTWQAMRDSFSRQGGVSNTGKRAYLPQFKKGTDGVIRRVDDVPVSRPEKVDTEDAISDVLRNEKLSPRVKETVRELEGTVYEDTRIIPEDIAQRLKNPDGAYNKDLSRVLDSTATDKETREVLRDKIERPLWQAKGEYATEVTNILNGYYDDMKRLGIKMGSKESAAVQWYGEGQRQVNKGKGSVEIESYTLADLRRDFPDTWENIVEADRINRSIYDKMLQRDNAALKEIYPNVEQRALSRKNLLEHRIQQDTAELSKADVVTNPGYVRDLRNALNKNKKELAQLKADIESGEIFRNKRILPRKDYYHHFIEMEQGLGGLKNILSSSHDIDPELVGVSEFTKPKSKWAGFMQKRKGGQYVEDSVAAMVKYVPAAQYKASIDPQIARMRAVIRDIAVGTKDTRNANKFIEWSTDYAGDLAGKTNFLDRSTQKIFNRKFMKGIEWVNNRVKANAISLNLSSAVSQWFNLPNGVGYIKNPVDMAKGVADYCKMLVGNSEVRTELDQSSFLKERYLDNVINRFDQSVLSTPGKLADWLMEVGDKQATQIIWLSAHEQGKRKGISNPVEFADDITRRSVAGRGIGEIPMMQKSKAVKLLAPFQVEVNNSYQILKEKFKEKDAMGIMAIFLVSWLMNGVSEALVGRRVAFDPIDAIADAVKEVQGSEGSAATKVLNVGARLGGEALSNMPYGSQVADFALGLSDAEAKSVFGDSDPTRFGTGNIGLTTIAKPFASAIRGKDIDIVDPIASIALPRGGKQITRSLRAAQDLGYIPKEHINLNTGVSFDKNRAPGAYSTSGGMKFPIDTNPGNAALALAFGPYGTKEGKEYLRSGKSGLSPERTEKMLDAYEDAEIPPKVFFAAYYATKDMKADRKRDGSAIPGSKAAKVEQYVESITGLSSTQRKKLIEALK